MHTHTIRGPQSPASGFAAFLRPIAPKSLRAALGDEIERMIALLDALDGDPDLELDECDLEDSHDREDDPAENGIGDSEGLEEQIGCFDRSGDEPEPSPCSLEAFRESRQLCGHVTREARSLSARLGRGR